MDRGRKRSDSNSGDSGESPADNNKRPCTAEASSSSAAGPPPAAAEAAGSDMDTSSSGHVGGGEGVGDGDADYSCESDDGGGSPGRCGVGGGKFQRIVSALGAEAGESAQLAALAEICEALSFCMEDAGCYFPTEAAATALVRLAGCDGNPNVMLLSVRAITYLCDSMPRSADAVVRHGVLPVLCGRLLAIEYLDVAEQCLQALEKISRKQPTPCLQAGMIAAVLAYIDFFASSIQRVAVAAVANVCKKVPADCTSLVMESVPTLCNLLQYEDKKLVEAVATCLVRIVDSFSTSPQLLDELCHQGVLQKVLNLISIGGLTSLSQTTCTSLIGLLTKLASGSLVAVKSLFELNMGSTIRGILVASDLSHGMPYLPFENAQFNQVHEALKLVNQLIPPAARDVEHAQMVLAKEKILLDEPNFLHQFSKDILPVLVKAVNSGANLYICYGCASIVNNICYFSKPEILLDLLKETNISSFLAGLLARKDHHVLVTSLKIVENLMQKLPDVYLNSFIKEGVVYAVEALVVQEKCLESASHLSDDMQPSENQPVARNTSRCLCYAFDSCKSEASDGKLCRIGKDNLYTFARHVKTSYFTHEAVSSEMGLTEILQKLKTCCAVLNETMDKSSNFDGLQNEEYLTNILGEVMMELYGGETMTTFEFLESGLVRSLANYLSNGKYLQENLNGCNFDHFLTVLKRFQSFARVSFSKIDEGWEKMLLTLLVRKLQNALTSLDNFPVIVSHAFKRRNNISDIPVRHSTILPCIRVHFKKEEDETSLSSYDSVVNVEVSSSLDTIEEYLWPKVSLKKEKQQAESSANNIFSESKFAEASPQDTDATKESSSNSSEGLTSQKQHSSSVEENSKQGISASDDNPNIMLAGASQVQAGTSAVTSNDSAVQPKLVFSLKGNELDRSVTLYQSILQDQMNAGPDIVLGPEFWSNVYDVTIRSATNPEPGNSSNSVAVRWPSLDDNKTGFSWQALPFFSSLLLAKLPCKLDKSNPSYDILFMLKVLEGLNRFSFHLLSDERSHAFAQERITNFDDLKVAISTVPQQEFVSTKLTDKLEQQMRDPLVSSFRCMPLWCTELLSACPFLFSFEARWKYFRLTTFGSSTIQSSYILDRNSSENNVVNERASNVVSYTRKKFKVNRGNILESAAKMMQSHARSKASLEVEYNEEVGTGLGPTMEFYTLISHEFQKCGLGMWRGELHCDNGTSKVDGGTRFVVAPCGLFPRPWSAAASSVDGAPFSEVTKRFRLLGQIIAKAIKDGRILDMPFSKAFYKLILEQDLSMYDIQSFDPELGRSLLEFQALASRRSLQSSSRKNYHGMSDLCYRGSKMEDLGIDFTLPGYADFMLSSESSSKMVNIENLEEYVALVVDATVRNGISRQVEAFKSGFNEVFSLKTIQVFSEDELERLLCGEQENWDFAKLVDHIKFDHGYTASSPPVINLLEIIQEFECHQRRAFLQFITGSPRLPPGGLAALNPKLTVVRKHSSGEADVDLPSVMTCANYLKLPAYSSKERMRQKLVYAITEGQGSFHLS